MEKRKNRRTLKKRMKRAMSLSAFFTVLFLSGVIIYMVLMFSKGYAEYQAEMVSYSIQQQLNSADAIKFLGIHSLDEIDNSNHKIKMWIDDINRKTKVNEIIPYAGDTSNIYITIVVKDKILYSNEKQSINALSKFYGDTQSKKPILDSNNKKIGKLL